MVNMITNEKVINDQLSILQNDKNDHHWLGMESNCIESLMLVDYW